MIAHEYFHNWTGDRVTCRDWFQLTLKEGLTMYRDSRYTADMTAASTKRICIVCAPTRPFGIVCSPKVEALTISVWTSWVLARVASRMCVTPAMSAAGLRTGRRCRDPVEEEAALARAPQSYGRATCGLELRLERKSRF